MHRESPQAQEYEDEFTRGIRKMFNTKRITFWLGFAAQVFLDIDHILGDHVKRPYDEFAVWGRKIEKSIQETRELHSAEFRIRELSELADPVFNSILNLVKLWIHSGSMQPFQEKFKIFTLPPLFRGMFMFRMKLFFQKVERRLSTRWAEMEFVMDWHNEVFVGTRPSGPKAFLRRFILTIGISATIFARNRRQSFPAPNGFKHMKPIPNLSQMFFQRECEKSKPTGFSEADIWKLLASGLWQFDGKNGDEDALSMKRTAGDRKAAAKKNKATASQLSAGELLKALRNTLQSEAPERDFDYLRMHRMCWRLMKSVKAHCDASFVRQLFPSEYTKLMESEIRPSLIVGSIFFVLEEMSALQLASDKLLTAAASCFNDLLDADEEAATEDSRGRRDDEIALSI
ncbi:uncharacterized protein BDV17DRAFT_275298 [Aspergillus undulatus]|uniref:uncharacterized protein n=1 Tax=Aspergillus undulatus TaxID=1810928 RepID=UPI003CCD6EA1